MGSPSHHLVRNETAIGGLHMTGVLSAAAVGVDACKTGWIAVALREGAEAEAHYLSKICVVADAIPDARGNRYRHPDWTARCRSAKRGHCGQGDAGPSA